MEIETPSDLLVRRGVLAALMIGLALAFIIQGRQPGLVFYLAGGGLAFVFLLASFGRDRRLTGWLGILAYLILVGGFLTGKNGLLGMLLGVFLAALTAFEPYDLLEDEDEQAEEADGSLDRFQSAA